MADEKKIVSDENWKTEAKQTKEKLEQREQEKAPEGGAGSEAGAMGPLPEANFLTLVNSLVLQSLLYMGRLGDPNDKERESMVNLDLANHHIDLLQVLEDKTKGNLSDEENKALSMGLHELRMQYVQTSS